MKENSPASLVVPGKHRLLTAGHKTLTVAPGMAAPVWSTTLPLKRPATWALEPTAASRTAKTKQ